MCCVCVCLCPGSGREKVRSLCNGGAGERVERRRTLRSSVSRARLRPHQCGSPSHRPTLHLSRVSAGTNRSNVDRSIRTNPLTDLSVLAFILFTVFPDRLGRSSLFLNSFRFHPVSTGARLPFPFFPFRVTSVPLHPLFLSPSFHHFSLIQKKAAAITTATMVFVCLSTPPCPSSHTLLWTTSSKALFFPPVSLSLFVAPPTPRQKKKNRTNDKKEAPAALHINRWTNGSRRSNPIFRLFNLPVRPVIPQLNWPDHQQ